MRNDENRVPIAGQGQTTLMLADYQYRTSKIHTCKNLKIAGMLELLKVVRKLNLQKSQEMSTEFRNSHNSSPFGPPLLIWTDFWGAN
ncbi:hypothetical protein R6Q59_020601 [Mikania micrantha]